MKKTAAILLLSIFLFNLFGYRWWLSYMEGKADDDLAKVISKVAYAEADLISIKTPVSVPYYNNSSSFESTEGEVNINGSIYRFVKHRIYNDSVELLCIPNKTKQELLSARNDYFKLINDLQQNGPEKKKSHSDKTIELKKMLSEYERNSIWQISVFHPMLNIDLHSYVNIDLGILYKRVIEQPPPAIS